MGAVIDAGAALERIEAHVRKAEENARLREGEIAAEAAARLGPALTLLDDSVSVLEAAKTAEATAWVVVLARDEAADRAIGSVRDEGWNALGRPRTHAAMEATYPGGVRTYTAGPPQKQPTIMLVLNDRITKVEAPQWKPEMRSAWIAKIDAARLPYDEALKAHEPLDAALTVAEAGYRAAVRSAHARLTAFKRDLKNLGLTETQIHAIIPDANDDVPTPRKKVSDPTPPADG